LGVLSKDDLLQLRVRLKTALKGIADARKQVDGYNEEASHQMFFAELCGAASAVKGAADIIMAALEKVTGPSGRLIHAGYSFSTGGIEAYSTTGLARIAAIDKMGQAAADATGFGATPGAYMQTAKAMRAIGVGTAKTVNGVSGGEYVGGVGAHVEQLSRLAKLGGQTTREITEGGETIATWLEGGQDILTGIERVRQSMEEMKRLNETREGALKQIDKNVEQLNGRLLEVESEIARRNASPHLAKTGT